MSPANSLSSIVDENILAAFVKDIDGFIATLSQTNDLVVHHRINQFYYMEKAAEVRVLCNRIDELRERLRNLETNMAACYEMVNENLIADKSWLKSYTENIGK